MKDAIRCLGLDVHVETIALAIADESGEVRSHGRILSRFDSIKSIEMTSMDSHAQARAKALRDKIRG